MLTNEPPVTQPDAQPPSGDTRHAIWVAFGFAVVAIGVAIVALTLTLTDDEGTTTGTTTVSSTTSVTPTTGPTTPTTTAGTATSVSTTTTSTSTSSTAASTSEPSTTQSTVFDPVETAVWPLASSSTRFSDPASAAESFATEYLAMADPEIGEFQQGDSRSGEIEIKVEPDGPVTTVLLRQLDATNSWWVLGSVAAEVTVDQPVALAEIMAPVIVSGEAGIADGGELVVEVRADGNSSQLAVMTISVPAGEPSLFRLELLWDDPGADWGALVVLTRDVDDAITGGHVTRVRFAPTGS